MFKQNTSKFAGFRMLNRNEKAGGNDNPPVTPPKKTDEELAAEEILKGVDLPSEKLEVIKKDPDLLKLFEHNLKAKREANQEAKANREKLEKLENERKAKEEEALAKKGEFESLYKKSKEELTAKDQKIKDMLIQKELGIHAVQLGIKNADYLKLFDVNDLEVDLDSLTVKNVESKLKKFKETYPDFFGEAKKVEVNNDKPNNRGEIPDDDELKKLELRAKQTRLPRDIAAWNKAKAEAGKK